MKKIFIFIALAIIFVTTASVWQSRSSAPAEPAAPLTQAPSPSPEAGEEVHYHAGFQVYNNDKLKDFSLLEYMHIEPCTEEEEHEEETLSAAEEQIEKAHLHDFVPDVVHVHRQGSVWQDLFTNLNYPVDPAQAYVNGQKVTDILSQPIEAYDSVVIFEGQNSDIEAKLETAVTHDHIEATEAEGESC